MKFIKLSQIIREWAHAGYTGFADIENRHISNGVTIIDDVTRPPIQKQKSK